MSKFTRVVLNSILIDKKANLNLPCMNGIVYVNIFSLILEIIHVVRSCVYQGIRNGSFSENFAYILEHTRTYLRT